MARTLDADRLPLGRFSLEFPESGRQELTVLADERGQLTVALACAQRQVLVRLGADGEGATTWGAAGQGGFATWCCRAALRREPLSGRWTLTVARSATTFSRARAFAITRSESAAAVLGARA